MGKRTRAEFERVFWLRVDKSDGTDACWIWTGSRTSGYGNLSIGGKSVGAHRVAYELEFGSIPDGLSVLHKCDVKSCVNPGHLFLGTQDDNMKDMASKGRYNCPRGASHTRFKVTSAGSRSGGRRT